MALEGKTPDERRKGVNGLADCGDGTSDWAVKAFDSIARSDPDAMVRCAAIRALQPTCGAQTVPTLLKLMAGDSSSTEDVRQAPAVVRWEAAKVLLLLVDGFRYDEAQRAELVAGLLDRLKNDADRNVRLTVTDTLAYFAQQPIPEALINAMETDDFAQQHAAEQSLIALTGTTHHHDADAWRTWLAEHPDPFEKAGQTPPELQQAEKSWWQW
jgi:HEAT repeat protein